MAAGWLNAPTFPDATQTRVVGVARSVILGTIVASLAGLLLAPFVYPNREPYVLFGLVIAWSIPSLWLLQRGHVRVAALSFIGMVWAVVLYAGVQYGGPRAPAMVALPVLILMTGFLAGARAAIGLGLLSAVMTLALTIGGTPDPSVELTPLRYWLAVTISVLMTAAMVSLGLRAIDAAIAEARASERRYAEMVEASPDGMVSFNSEGVIESINPAAARIGGFAPHQFEGERFLDLGAVPSERIDWVIRNLPKAFTGDFTGPAEIEIRRADGSLVPIEVRVRRVKRRDGSIGAQATLRDLSERRAAAREVEDLQARLLHSQKLESVGRLAGGVAHDFNNHLTAIRINSELLDHYLPEGSEGREVLAGVEMAAERSGNLIRQLLAFSRKQILRPLVIDLNELVTGLEPMLRRILPEDIELRLSCDGGLWHVRADWSQIETALLNLVVNARDAMPTGGTLALETANVTRPAGSLKPFEDARSAEFVRVVVRDSGVGIGEDDQSRIFEPFFSTKGERGSGLGLSTVHGIVHQSGGWMTVESEPDRGSRFLIYLPRVDEPLDVEPDAESETLAGRIEGRVLLVEDDDAVRALAISVLRERGCEVWAASDGLEALDLIKRENLTLDLLVTDIVMPRLGGIGLARALRDSQPSLPVLFISGYVEGPGRPALDANSDLLDKPFNGRTLALRVHAMLSRA